ncbi:hypothetical protein H6P81_011266 [Aristolochia fimbriata]|uniref:Uncharacterized protein n=1 Tax=Aristolochia fimbriata TaxID=158543 RepID=A0AAV7ETY2_ARIFI|nr:hypothetical protein H6P81_011266 [Aristolochia fimbriata]
MEPIYIIKWDQPCINKWKKGYRGPLGRARRAPSSFCFFKDLQLAGLILATRLDPLWACGPTS